MRQWPTDDLDDIVPDPNSYGTVTALPIKPPPLALESTCAADLFGKTVPTRPWLVPDLLPDRTVTTLSGDGGVGKSLLAKQLAVAVSTGGDWVGTLPERGTVLFLTAEDDPDEVHRRLVDIVEARGGSLADLVDLHVVNRAGKDAILAAPARGGLLSPTPLWEALVRKIALLRPRLVVLDTQADLFGGNEIDRREVRQFITMLRGIAIDHDLAVLLLSHPSVAGMTSGTGTSGSTAWNNSVRSRLYLDRPKADDGEELDADLRVLRVMKANYGRIGDEIRLRWKGGVFRLDNGESAEPDYKRAAATASADKAFLDMLAKFTASGRTVSPKNSPSYAPSLFAKHADNKSNKRAYQLAMDRLLEDGRIRCETKGPPSRQYTFLVAE